MRYYFLLVFILTLFLPGCDLREREEALNQKEASLNEREQELLLKEKTLQLKEEDLVKREQRIDSTRLQDSVAVYNAALPGTWDVKMVGAETTCPGSAVGDTKNETWEITYQENNVIARAMVNNELVRTYSGFLPEIRWNWLIPGKISRGSRQRESLYVCDWQKRMCWKERGRLNVLANARLFTIR